MKFFVYLAAIVAVTSAFATKSPDDVCYSATQYYWNGFMYLQAGVYGEDFDCEYDPAVTCTYWRPNPVTQPNVYKGCRLGIFIELGARANQAKAK